MKFVCKRCGKLKQKLAKYQKICLDCRKPSGWIAKRLEDLKKQK